MTSIEELGQKFSTSALLKFEVRMFLAVDSALYVKYLTIWMVSKIYMSVVKSCPVLLHWKLCRHCQRSSGNGEFCNMSGPAAHTVLPASTQGKGSEWVRIWWVPSHKEYMEIQVEVEEKHMCHWYYNFTINSTMYYTPCQKLLHYK
jgi:hypothetical protein